MEIYKIIAVGVVSAVLIVYLKATGSELALPATVCAGTIILFMTFSYVTEFVAYFKEIGEAGGVDFSVFKIVIKIIVVSCLVQFAATTVEDFGMKSIAEKMAFAGKILILCMSAPMVKNLVEVVSGMI